MFDQIQYNQCEDCGWDFLQQNLHAIQSQQLLDEFHQLEKIQQTRQTENDQIVITPQCGYKNDEIIGQKIPTANHLDCEEGEYKQDLEQDLQEDSFQYQSNCKKGRPPKRPSLKLNDFNKYLVRKLKKIYPKCLSEDFGNKAINKRNFQKIRELCRFQIINLLNQKMIPFLKRKRLKSSAPCQFPFDNDKLNKNKALIYLRHSQELVQDLKKVA